VPTFVIITSYEVLFIPASAFATLNEKVSLCLYQLKLFNNSIVPEAALPRSTEPNTTRTTAAKSSFVVVLRNLPPGLIDSLSRKNKLESLAGQERIVPVKPKPNEKHWFVVTRDKSSAISLAASAMPNLQNTSAKVIDRKSLGIETASPQFVKANQIRF